MKKVAFGALFAGLLVACGGGKSNPDGPVIVTVDSGTDGGDTSVCNVVAQSGCDTGEKCTWVRVAASDTQQLGQVGCVPDGSIDANAACAYGAAGSATGYDDCKAGLICLASSKTDMAAGECRPICDLTAASGATGACPTNYGCSQYSHFFSNSSSDTPVAGVCDPLCDPLTNSLLDTSAGDPTNCGGGLDSTSGLPVLGCYGLPSGDANPSEFTCSGAGDDAKKMDADATSTDGNIYLNGCAVGYIPLLYAATGSTSVICTAFCKPAPTNINTPANKNGEVGSGSTCIDKGGIASHECKYWWWFEDATTPVSQWSNGLGFCMNIANYMYDSTGDGTADTGFPSCAAQDPTKYTYDTTMMTTDDLYWGCGPVPTSLKNVPKHAPSPLKPLLTPAQMMQLAKTMN
jgi:hypothetical protein